MEDSKLDNRTTMRLPLAFYVEVEDAAPDEEVYLVDLSNNGARIFSPNPIEEGSVLDGKVVLKGPDNDETRVGFRFEVRWCRPADRTGYHDVGCAIGPTNDYQRRALDFMLSEFATRKYT